MHFWFSGAAIVASKKRWLFGHGNLQCVADFFTPNCTTSTAMRQRSSKTGSPMLWWCKCCWASHTDVSFFELRILGTVQSTYCIQFHVFRISLVKTLGFFEQTMKKTAPFCVPMWRLCCRASIFLPWPLPPWPLPGREVRVRTAARHAVLWRARHRCAGAGGRCQRHPWVPRSMPHSHH